ncbi:hypothetical protein [Halorussus halobius]|uniref:hypothetical protein n=1 Tax=Halorussus halobius TaxID=1710537 RepID=UPI001091B951|nr:hypothetical protein [Halorussus halobius]
MTTVTAVLVPAVLSLLALATIGATVESLTERSTVTDWLQRLHLKLLAPNWNFFAPHPGQWDTHLLYRDELADGTVTQWTEVTDVTQTRQRLKWVWNPSLYKAKGLFDLNQALKRHLEGSELAEVDESSGSEGLQPIESDDHLLSTQYLLLLNVVSGADHDDDARRTQFMLMQSSLREEEATPQFVSNFHEL